VYDLVYELWYVCVIVVSECYAVCLNRRSIDFEFGSSPVSALGVVPDLVVGFISEPVGERSVLSLLLGESFLHEEGLVCTHVWI